MEDLASSTTPTTTEIRAGEVAEKDIVGLIGLVVAMMRLTVVLMEDL